MARNKANQANIDKSNLADYPNGRIKDNTGLGDGTPVNEQVKGDIHEFFDKVMRLYGINHNNLPDNENNGYQLVDAVIALASKNDFLLDLSSFLGVLTVPVKLGKLKVNESILLKANVDKTTQTQIKGSDGVTKSVTFVGDFKVGDYVRFINTATGVTLVRQVDLVNVATVLSELGYLLKATLQEGLDGVADDKAITPLVLAGVLSDSLNMTLSANYLASAIRNGLLSKEQFSLIENRVKERNFGTFAGIDFDDDAVGTTYVTTGDLADAEKTAGTPDGGVITVTMANAMDNTNYSVLLQIENTGDIETSNDYRPLTFEIVSTTQFKVYIEHTVSGTRNVKIHCTVTQR